jgi:hypothetical protein
MILKIVIDIYEDNSFPMKKKPKIYVELVQLYSGVLIHTVKSPTPLLVV